MNNMTIGTNSSLATYGKCIQNNFSNPTFPSTTQAFLIHTSTDAGQLVLPGVIFFGDTTAGSTDVLNVAPTDGETLSSSYAMGDWFITPSVGNNFPYGAAFTEYLVPWDFGTTISSVTDYSAPNTAKITVNTAAKLTGRFPIFPLPVGVGQRQTDLGLRVIGAAAPTPILPTCQSGIAGVKATITDSNTTTVGSPATSGGSSTVAVVCSPAATGSKWIVLAPGAL